MDSPNTLQGLLQFTASIAAEFYVGRAGEPVPTGDGRAANLQCRGRSQRSGSPCDLRAFARARGAIVRKGRFALWRHVSLLEDIATTGTFWATEQCASDKLRTLRLGERYNGKYVKSSTETNTSSFRKRVLRPRLHPLAKQTLLGVFVRWGLVVLEHP